MLSMKPPLPTPGLFPADPADFTDFLYATELILPAYHNIHIDSENHG